MKPGACFGRLQVFIIASQLGLSIEKVNRLRLPQWFILYLLLVPLAGTSFPARCGSYLGDHIAPAPPAQWCVYQYRTPHSCRWSHSDTLCLLHYTAGAPQIREIVPAGGSLSAHAQPCGVRPQDWPALFQYTDGYSASPAVPTGRFVPLPYFTPTAFFPHRPVRASLLPARSARRGPARSAV